MRKKLGILALFTLMFQTTMPIYQYTAFAEEPAEEVVEQQLFDENADADLTEKEAPVENENNLTDESEEPEKIDKEVDQEADQEVEEDQELDQEAKDSEKETSDVNSEIGSLAVGKDLGNIYTFNSFKVDDVEFDGSSSITISDDTIIAIEYKWDTIDKDAKNGLIGFSLLFNMEKFQEDVVQEVKFLDTTEKTITIIGEPSIEVSSINKKGIAKKDGVETSTDANEITWTVDVTNPGITKITDAKLTDTIPDGLAIDASNFKITHLNIGIDGSLTPGGAVTNLSSTITG